MGVYQLSCTTYEGRTRHRCTRCETCRVRLRTHPAPCVEANRLRAMAAACCPRNWGHNWVRTRASSGTDLAGGFGLLEHHSWHREGLAAYLKTAFGSRRSRGHATMKLS